MSSYLVAALYKFVDLPNPAFVQSLIAGECDGSGITGTILLAREGINGTIAGPEAEMRTFLKWLCQRDEFIGLDIKESSTESPPFHRLKVRLKKEIVTLGVPDIDAANDSGDYVDPSDWNDLISEPDVIVVDTRNDYEVAIGTFKGAISPDTTSFREFPKWVDEQLNDKPDTKIAMFCTGGIRCEKSTALLKSRGFENVYHLKGGILKYLENIEEKESLWNGECFVFDQRVSVTHGLERGRYEMCHACRMPIDSKDLEHEHYQQGVSCHHCFDNLDDAKRQRFEERQLQMELAHKRNEKHIAADISVAKSQKKQQLKLHKERSRNRSV